MNGRFLPIDLTSYVNVGPSCGARWTPDGPAVRCHSAERSASLEGFPSGRRRLWGVPFRLAEPNGNGASWVLTSGDASSGLPGSVTVTLPTPTIAESLVFAHCADVDSPSSRVGDLLATYTLVLANGSRSSWPIRRGFEIVARRPGVGLGRAYTAVSHNEPRPSRVAGASRHELGGAIDEGDRQSWWLWGVDNPRPEQPIVAIELAARHADVVVLGAITLVRQGSNPLRRSGRTRIRVDLPPPGEAGKAAPAQDDEFGSAEQVAVAGTVALSVDVGQVVRVGPARDTTPEKWRAAPVKGWGEPVEQGEPSSVHAEVYAADGAELTVLQGDSTWTVPWREIERGEARSADGRVRVQVVDGQRARLKVAVVDAETGKELATRAHFRGPTGEYLPPLGHSPEVNVNWDQNIGGDLRLGATNYAYVPGRYEVELPVGTVYVDAVHGFEYTPIRDALTIAPGQTELRLPMRRLVDLKQRGFYSGDVHVHFLDPTTAELEAAAEDLNVTELLAIQHGRLHEGTVHGIGREAAGSTHEHVLRVDSENRHHMLGHIFLLGLTEPVLPLSSGGYSEDELGGWDEVAMADWCDKCRAQGGLVVTQFTPTPHAEVVADIILGKIDATEVRWFDFFPPGQPGGHWGDTPFAFPGVAQWYRYLNCGYRVPAVGGTDKMTNAIAIGALRTYVRLQDGEEFSYQAWNRAIRRGRTFVSCGPLIELEVEGREPGDEIALPKDGGTLNVKATARSAQPFERIEIVVNGLVVARGDADASGLAAELSATVEVTESSWIAARCYGRDKLWTTSPIDVGAHTSPVWVVVDGRRQSLTGDASQLLTLIEGGLAYLDSLAAFRSPTQREHHRNVFLAGREALLHHHPEARPHWHRP
jgi:hypothetical protein